MANPDYHEHDNARRSISVLGLIGGGSGLKGKNTMPDVNVSQGVYIFPDFLGQFLIPRNLGKFLHFFSPRETNPGSFGGFRLIRHGISYGS
jgi:hypothetical protein